MYSIRVNQEEKYALIKLVDSKSRIRIGVLRITFVSSMVRTPLLFS